MTEPQGPPTPAEAVEKLRRMAAHGDRHWDHEAIAEIATLLADHIERTEA